MASSSTANRSGNGRKKVNMVKIEKKSNLQVTFSKRRSGLFKKASELCTLTGSEAGIVVFSPGNKVFSFGNPSVLRIMDRCFPEAERNEFLMQYDDRLVESHKSIDMGELNMELTRMELQLEAEKKRAAAIKEREKAELMWMSPVENMMQPQVNEMGACLQALKDIVVGITNNAENPSLNPTGNLAPLPDMGDPGLNDQFIYEFNG